MIVNSRVGGFASGIAEIVWSHAGQPDSKRLVLTGRADRVRVGERGRSRHERRIAPQGKRHRICGMAPELLGAPVPRECHHDQPAHHGHLVSRALGVTAPRRRHEVPGPHLLEPRGDARRLRAGMGRLQSAEVSPVA